MVKKISFFFCLIYIFFSLYIPSTHAEGIVCENRYLTLVNPVRGRDLWVDKTLKPLEDQYFLIHQNDFSATWLLQFDTLQDNDLLGKVKDFDGKQELGVFLEVSQNLANQAGVVYPSGIPWYKPNVVFLSGYSQSDRRKLIDKLFFEFYQKFSYYPKSVGAWWIDSYSLNYLEQKYKIQTAMIVADQKLTDGYRVWGQWWGMPYFPTKANILMPANSLSDKEDVVIIQWAQRDFSAAVGGEAWRSLYSLQANDYVKLSKDVDYFNQLVDIYLDCGNKIGQVTVGLETGMESVGSLNEYQNQLQILKGKSSLQSFTMKQFGERFVQVYPSLPDRFSLTFNDGKILMDNRYRLNSGTKENIAYSQDLAFPDYFLPDKQDFLERDLTSSLQSPKSSTYYPLFWIMIILLGGWFYLKKEYRLFLVGLLFTISAFGLILRSNFQYGWFIFYGPVVLYLQLVQSGLVAASFLTIILLARLLKRLKSFQINYFFLLPLSFGLDYLIQSFRFSILDKSYYLGFAIDNFRFIGIVFSKPFSLIFVNKNFSSAQLSAFLRIDYEKIWNNLFFAFGMFPLVHIIMAILLGILLWKMPPRIKGVFIAILVILFLLYISSVFQADPRQVLPG